MPTDAKSGETAIVDGSAEGAAFAAALLRPARIGAVHGGRCRHGPRGWFGPEPRVSDAARRLCAHEFATVGNTRQFRFAPSGELFVASPTRHTTGGGPAGQAAIVVLPTTMVMALPTHRPSSFATCPPPKGCSLRTVSSSTKTIRVSCASPSQRRSRRGRNVPSLAAEVPYYSSTDIGRNCRDQADDGTIYVTNGDDEQLGCDAPAPSGAACSSWMVPLRRSRWRRGFRNPIALRRLRGKNLCYAVELSRDYSGPRGGREKIVPVRDGDDWGFPCCATQNLPFGRSFLARIARRSRRRALSFLIGDTPFGIDFELGKWPAPYTNGAFVPLHGAVETWAGARVVAIAVDPSTGSLQHASDVDGSNTGAMIDFGDGLGRWAVLNGRPAVVAFAADGRLFLGNDSNGQIIWIAPSSSNASRRREEGVMAGTARNGKGLHFCSTT